jgi:hypothetical protein
MEVVGLYGNHVGTVDHLEAAERIILSKDDPKAGGQSANSVQPTKEVSDGEAPVTSVNCTRIARLAVRAKASVARVRS